MTRPLNVLIVEGNVDAGETLAEVLEIYGHEPTVARSGAGAMKLFRWLAVDAVCVDIDLPETDWFAAAKKLRRLSRRPLLLVAVTGHPGYEAWSLAEGFDYHLVKPFDPAVLSTLLWEHAVRLAEM
jgi:CheY-like chemotaxis protein